MAPYKNFSVIVPGISQGSAVVDPSGAMEEFDIVVLCAQEFQPRFEEIPFGKYVIRFPYNDSPYLPPEVIQRAHAVAKQLAEEHERGKNILITCMMGLNRSGLVTALTLIYRFNLSGSLAIQAVQNARPYALSNDTFCKYLMNIKPY